MAFLDSLEKKPETEATADKSDEDEAAKAWREHVEEIRQKFAYEARTQIPPLVEEWKDVMARRNRAGITAEEFIYLQNERKRIEDQLSFLANNYNAVFREERAIYYPDGWIGRYLKQVGIVYAPASQEDIQAALESSSANRNRQ